MDAPPTPMPTPTPPAPPDLGPFRPPPEAKIEPELALPAPRPIADEVRRGRHGKGQRAAVTSLAVVGLVAWALGASHVLDRLAYYVLPLGYLTWIGAGSLVAATLVWGADFLGTGPYRYVRWGVPATARVLGLAKVRQRVGEGEVTFLAAQVEFKNPETGEHTTREVRSPALPMAGSYEPTLRVGDYVTAVYLPGKLEKTLTLYGFLGLSPSVDFIGKKSAAVGCIAIAMILVAVVGALLAALYGMEFYAPIDAPAWLVATSGAAGLVLGAIATMAIARHERRKADALAARNEVAAREGRPIEMPAARFGRLKQGIVVLGAALLAGLAVGAAICAANALLDRSEPKYEPVQIVNFWQTTHEHFIRTYSIEYRRNDNKELVKFPATREHMAEFTTDVGALEVHEGFLGMRWIKEIHPLRPR